MPPKASTKSAEDTVVLFGNSNPQVQVVGEDGIQIGVPASHLNQSVTRITFTPETFDEEKVGRTLSTDNDRILLAVADRLADEHRPSYALAVYEAEQIMGIHSAGAKPDWVSSSDENLARALSAHFNCPLGEPVALVTNVGRDALHEQHISNSAQPATFQYGALSASGTALAEADTTLVSEITTASGGLLRAKMTFAHTVGTNTSTLTFTWTANGSDSLPVTLKKWANFNKSVSGGTIGEEGELSSSATLTVSGDSCTVTFTLTAA